LDYSITSKDLAGINLMPDIESKALRKESENSSDPSNEASSLQSNHNLSTSINNSISSENGNPSSLKATSLPNSSIPPVSAIEDIEDHLKLGSLTQSLDMKEGDCTGSPEDSPPRDPEHSEEVDFFDPEHNVFSCPAASPLGLTNSNSSRRRRMDDCRPQLQPAEFSREEPPKHSENDQDLDWFSFLQEPVSVTDKTAKPKIGKGLYVSILEQRVKELEDSILHLRRIAPSKPANKLLKSTRVTQTILNPSTVERPLKIVKKRIEVGERISSGASLAVVYSCYVDGWLCAMKELNTENISSLDIQTFQEEIRLLEYLPKHPNVCQYLFHDYSDNKIRLFMTNYHTTLRAELDKRELLLQASEIAIHAHDIIKGLEFLHRNSVIHRDLKAENVFGFLDPDDKICSLVIGDFDTAKRITNKEALNSVAGSPAWMAPEVLNANLSGEEYSFPVDVYSFGMTLYEILSLKTPYETVPFLMLTEHILSGELPELPQAIVDDESYGALLELYLGCVRHDASQRLSIGQIKTALDGLIPNPKLKHLSK